MTDRADILVVGTDTNAGKSVVSLLLMQLLFRTGVRPFYLKPFQTGCRDAYDDDSDAAFVYRHTEELQSDDPGNSVIQCYPNPKAPYFAARDMGERIDPDQVMETIGRYRLKHHPLVIESAGGLMVPLTDQLVMLDLIQAFDCHVVLVARAGLGTINHTLLSVAALRQAGVPPVGVVFIDSATPQTDPSMVAENMAAVEHHAAVNVFGTIPPIGDFSSPPDHAYEPLKQLLEKLAPAAGA